MSLILIIQLRSHAVCTRPTLTLYAFNTFLYSFFKESFEIRKRIPKSTSHGSFGVHAMYNRHSYTPSLPRSPQHFHRPGEKNAPRQTISVRRDMNPPLFTFFPLCCTAHLYLLCLLNTSPQHSSCSFHWNNKQGWCSLLLYSLAPMKPAALLL